MRKATKIVVSVTAVAATLSLMALFAADGRIKTIEFNAVVAFAVFSVFGALMPYSLSERISASATFVTFLASVVLVPSWLSVEIGRAHV